MERRHKEALREKKNTEMKPPVSLLDGHVEGCASEDRMRGTVGRFSPHRACTAHAHSESVGNPR